MAENANGAEKTELPTPKRLQEARDEGQVAFSADVNTSMLLLVGFIVFIAMGPWFLQAMAEAMRHAVGGGLAAELDHRSWIRDAIMGNRHLIAWLAVFLAVMFTAAVIVCVAQVGFHPTLKPLMPKAKRINPLSGLKRIFGLRGLMRFVFNLIKLVLVIAVAWLVLRVDIANQLVIPIDLRGRLAYESWQLAVLGMKLAAVLVTIAGADYLYQRFQHTRDLMMTKQEVKEEYKQSEGDPLIRAKVRQIQRQMAQRRMMQEVPKADVVITNPTHVAVALKYDKATMAAPVVVAKGYDDLAQKIKDVARANGITLVENVPLARALAKEVAVGKAVSVKWYQAVAEILAMVYKLKKAG